ncbi:MAG: ATP-grasp domain-containing protein [Selenomonas sp.]|uniref:ATP-binding protein n=1 Tax=Selenomonas sp. TaxID=2053611 RepID=UPI0025D0F9E3|nr:ATP-grasp domain-containing protein [Selenomonas sp.]MCI6231675.1 ATP-grasp domain-containing protein [Selenomonas sp.]
MKRILMLGGNYVQSAAIERAKALGYHTIVVDMDAACYGRGLADEFYHISTTDEKCVYELARKKHVDGILSYVSDVSALTAAVVAERLSLPTNPSASVDILTHKDKFRDFMTAAGLRTPFHASFSKDEGDAALRFAEEHPLPLIVKPTDSAGSKGVMRVDRYEDFPKAFDCACGYARHGRIIVEQFIEKKGYEGEAEGFLCDGKIEFLGFLEQFHNDARNPFAPIGNGYPSSMEQRYRDKLRTLLVRVFAELQMNFGAFNVEFLVGQDDEVYLVEIGPRNGGNMIPEMVESACGVDMVTASVKACVGDDYKAALQPKYHRVASTYVIQSMKDGVLKDVLFPEELQKRIVKRFVTASRGDRIQAFRLGGDGLGTMVLRFDSVEQMDDEMSRMWDIIKVEVEELPCDSEGKENGQSSFVE